jgi:hypothetical protein
MTAQPGPRVVRNHVWLLFEFGVQSVPRLAIIDTSIIPRSFLPSGLMENLGCSFKVRSNHHHERCSRLVSPWLAVPPALSSRVLIYSIASKEARPTLLFIMYSIFNYSAGASIPLPNMKSISASIKYDLPDPVTFGMK